VIRQRRRGRGRRQRGGGVDEPGRHEISQCHGRLLCLLPLQPAAMVSSGSLVTYIDRIGPGWRIGRGQLGQVSEVGKSERRLLGRGLGLGLGCGCSCLSLTGMWEEREEGKRRPGAVRCGRKQRGQERD
jgi:hypothetical protein